MLVRALGAMAVVAGVGSCAETGGAVRRSMDAWLARPAPAIAQPAADPVASGRAAARSVWGVVPSAPRRKADLRPELITGSAVAVTANTLLANCAATEGRARVGLVRHNKYRIARVTPDAQGQLCRLIVAEGPLTPAAGWRSFADLRVGEPVLALANHGSAAVAAAPGWLAGKGAPEDPFLEVTSRVPAGNRSAVLVDGYGNLVGLGAAASVAGGLVLAVPVCDATVAKLANRDLGMAEVLVAALTPTPRAEPVQPPLLLTLGGDERDSRDRAPAARTADLGASEAADTPTPRATTSSAGSGATDSGSAASSGTDGGNDGTTTDAGATTAGDGAPGAEPPTGGTGNATEGGGATGGIRGDDGDDDGRSGRGRGRGGRDEARSRDDDAGGRGRGRNEGD